VSQSTDGGSDEDDDSNSTDDIKIMAMLNEVANEIEMEMDLISNHSNDSAAYRDLDETNDAAGNRGLVILDYFWREINDFQFSFTKTFTK
jgi:hypothetical protein